MAADRYRVKVGKKSGVINDINLFAPNNLNYIVGFVESFITISLKSMDIMESLPLLNEYLLPANWPAAWGMGAK